MTLREKKQKVEELQKERLMMAMKLHESKMRYSL
jgi:hypothetical protein